MLHGRDLSSAGWSTERESAQPCQILGRTQYPGQSLDGRGVSAYVGSLAGVPQGHSPLCLPCGEILELIQDRVDLKAGFIRLKDIETKTEGSWHSGGHWRWSPRGMAGYAAWIFITLPHVPKRSRPRWKSGAWELHRWPCERPGSDPTRRRPQACSRCGRNAARLMHRLTPAG
jgi:hypothetical protein